MSYNNLLQKVGAPTAGNVHTDANLGIMRRYTPQIQSLDHEFDIPSCCETCCLGTGGGTSL